MPFPGASSRARMSVDYGRSWEKNWETIGKKMMKIGKIAMSGFLKLGNDDHLRP